VLLTRAKVVMEEDEWDSETAGTSDTTTPLFAPL